MRTKILSLLKKTFLLFFVFLLGALFVQNVFAGVWSPPTVAPPNGNPDPPVNTGNVVQEKASGLWLHGGLTVDGNTFLSAFGGNVGIGTTSPAANLHIESTGGAPTGDELIIRTANSIPNDATFILDDSSANPIGFGDLLFKDHGVLTTLIRMSADANGGTYDFEERKTSGAASRLYISGNGNVGIGTTNPSSKLQVGNVGATYPGGANGSTFDFTVGVADGRDFPGDRRYTYIHSQPTSNIYGLNAYDYTNSTGLPITIGWSGQDVYLAPTGGNVGIGTTNPSEKIDVQGGKFRVTNTQIWDNEINRYGGDNLYIQYRNAATGGFPGGNTILNANGGNVGIGTISPTSKLDVAGEIHASGDICTDLGGGAGKCLSNAGGSSFWAAGVGANANDIYNSNTGNVGIGTVNPNAKLDVRSPGGALGDLGVIRLWSDQGNALGNTAGIMFGVQSLGSNVPKGAIGFVSNDRGRPTPIGIGDLVFALRQLNDNTPVSLSDERMRIDTYGGVTIGTLASPGSLTVAGAGSFYSNFIFTNQILNPGSLQTWIRVLPSLNFPAASSIATGRIGTVGDVYIGKSGGGYFTEPDFGPPGFTGGTGNVIGMEIEWVENNVQGKYLGDRVHLHSYNNSTGATPRVLTVDYTGNVGIGTTNPDVNHKLDVAGSIRAQNNVDVTGFLNANTLTALSFGNDSINVNNNALVVNGGGYFGKDLIVSQTLTARTKNFVIDHPLKKGYQLVHSSLEGPEVGVYYRGTARLLNGKTKVILPDYFDVLTRDRSATVLLTARGATPFLLSYDGFDEKGFVVHGTLPDGEFDWEVKATRQDVPPIEVERIKQQLKN